MDCFNFTVLGFQVGLFIIIYNNNGEKYNDKRTLKRQTLKDNMRKVRDNLKKKGGPKDDFVQKF